MRISLKKGRQHNFLESGVDYTVYAIYFVPTVKLMVMVDAFPSGPHAVCMEDVDVVDERLSKYWKIGSNISLEKPVLSFPAWSSNEYFYEDLLDGGVSAEVWRETQKLMDLEFADSRLQVEADSIGDGWLQCSNCMDAWQDSCTSEVVVCPSCSVKQRNPMMNYPED